MLKFIEKLLVAAYLSAARKAQKKSDKASKAREAAMEAARKANAQAVANHAYCVGHANDCVKFQQKADKLKSFFE